MSIMDIEKGVTRPMCPMCANVSKWRKVQQTQSQLEVGTQRAPRLLFSYNLILEPVSPASALVLIGVRGCLTSVNVSVTAAAGGR